MAIDFLSSQEVFQQNRQETDTACHIKSELNTQNALDFEFIFMNVHEYKFWFKTLLLWAHGVLCGQDIFGEEYIYKQFSTLALRCWLWLFASDGFFPGWMLDVILTIIFFAIPWSAIAWSRRLGRHCYRNGHEAATLVADIHRVFGRHRSSPVSDWWKACSKSCDPFAGQSFTTQEGAIQMFFIIQIKFDMANLFNNTHAWTIWFVQQP